MFLGGRCGLKRRNRGARVVLIRGDDEEVDLSR